MFVAMRQVECSRTFIVRTCFNLLFDACVLNCFEISILYLETLVMCLETVPLWLEDPGHVFGDLSYVVSIVYCTAGYTRTQQSCR